MKVGENMFVTLGYTLRVGGKVEDRSPEGQPLKFPYGMGFLLPKFEEHIAGLGAGDRFAFTLTPADGYGEFDKEAIVELPLDVFMIDGRVEEGLLTVGNHIPMSAQDGHSMLGVVKAVGINSATLDFNHPMAGKTLDFDGEIVAVRPVTPEDLAPFAGGCGCDDRDRCGDGCNCN
jgi:FKBP-type peptidyl-prolyl cis-trans isomerase SlyD